jgi:hypothetical protein
LSTIAQLQRLANRFDAELRTRRDALEAVSQKAADAPLRQADAWGASLGLKAAADAWKRYGTVIASHVASNAWGVAGLFAFFLGGAYWLLHATGKQVQEGLQNDAASGRGSAVFERPNSAALLAALIGLYWFGPPAPTAFQSLLGAVMPFPAAALAVTVFGKPIRLSIYTLAVVLATMSLRPLLDPLPLLSRFVVIAQAAATLFAVWSDYRRDRFTLALPVIRPSILRWSVLVVCIALVLTIVLEIVGLIGMAETLRMLVLGGLGIAVVIAAIAYVLIALALALVHLRPI